MHRKETAFCEQNSYLLKTVFYSGFGSVTCRRRFAVETQLIKTFKSAESKSDRWHAAVGDFFFYIEILSCVITLSTMQISKLCRVHIDTDKLIKLKMYNDITATRHVKYCEGMLGYDGTNAFGC